MAEIIQRTSQLEALEEIKESLALVGALNLALTQRTIYHIVAVDADGISRMRNCPSVPVEERSVEKVDAILKAQRDRLVKAVRQKADKFEIALDAGDNDILSGNPPQVKGRTRKVLAADKSKPDEDSPAEAEEANTPSQADADPLAEAEPVVESQAWSSTTLF